MGIPFSSTTTKEQTPGYTWLKVQRTILRFGTLKTMEIIGEENRGLSMTVQTSIAGPALLLTKSAVPYRNTWEE